MVARAMMGRQKKRESKLNTEGKKYKTGHMKGKSVVRRQRVNEEDKARYG
jgi:hypothetical protein